MVDIEYLGNAGDGFMVHVAGSAPRFIEPHAFLSTFGISAFEDHVLEDVDVRTVTEDYVEAVPPRFPQFTVKWQRESNGSLDRETGVVLFDGHPLTKVSASNNVCETVQQELDD